MPAITSGPRGFVLVAVAAVWLLTACRQAEAPQAPEIRPVRALTVDKRVGSDFVSLTGSVQAQTEVNLSFRVDGRMVERSANVGDSVRMGSAQSRARS